MPKRTIFVISLPDFKLMADETRDTDDIVDNPFPYQDVYCDTKKVAQREFELARRACLKLAQDTVEEWEKQEQALNSPNASQLDVFQWKRACKAAKEAADRVAILTDLTWETRDEPPLFLAPHVSTVDLQVEHK